MNAMVADVAVVASVAAGIPYRANSSVPPGTLVWAVLVTLLVLGGITAGLLLARRYGWLHLWAGGARTAKQGHDTWTVTARVRLSATARAYVLESENASYLVVESSQHLAIQSQRRMRGEESAREE